MVSLTRYDESNRAGGGTEQELINPSTSQNQSNTQTVLRQEKIEESVIEKQREQQFLKSEILRTPDTSYCIDANYWKGTTVQQYVRKHRRQLIFEHDGDMSE